MAPLIVLVAGALLVRVIGHFGVTSLRDWAAATRAGLALIVFLLAVLPANIHAARAGVTLRGAPATPIAPRVALQGLFIGLLWWSGVRPPRD